MDPTLGTMNMYSTFHSELASSFFFFFWRGKISVPKIYSAADTFFVM